MATHSCACNTCRPNNSYIGPHGKPPHGWDRLMQGYCVAEMKCLWICLGCHTVVYDEGSEYMDIWPGSGFYYLKKHLCPIDRD